MSDETPTTERKSRRRSRHDDQNAKAKSWIREWTDAIIFAAIAAIIIRTFFFEAYRIPTPSMEDTLLVGDFLIVSKIDYGPRTPMVLGVPFTTIYLPGISLPWTRLPGYGEVQRNDVVVFNYPIDIAPIAAKTNYVKRCVGLPHDTLRIDDKQLYVNGNKAQNFPGIQMNYLVTVQERVRLSPAKVKAAGGKLLAAEGPNTYRVNMTKAEAEKLRGWAEVKEVKPFVLPDNLDMYSRVDFNFSSGFKNPDHLPPVVVPFKGQKVTLTPQNWNVYEDIVSRYEHNTVQRAGDTFIINGEKTNSYTIKQNYYFMMGDNRDNSEDSRFWGFVPQSHIIGEASMIYFSWDAERFSPRFGRLFNFIEE